MKNRYQKKLYEAEYLPDIRSLLYRGKALYPHHTVMVEIAGKDQERRLGYRELCDNAEALGTAMIAHGMKNAHIAIIGENCIDWVQAYFAIVCGVGVAVPMDRELTESFVRTQLRMSDTSVVVCTDRYAKMIREIMDTEDFLKSAIIIHAEPGKEYPGFLRIDDLIEEGRKLLANGNRSFLDVEINPTEMCEIVFTSGTTGANKGVMLSNKNIMTVVHSAMTLIRVDLQWRSFSVLPLNHCYEKNTHLLGGMYMGLTICFNDNLKHVLNNLNRFKPGNSIMVPLFLDTFARRIRVESEKANLTAYMKYGIKFSNLIRKFGIDRRRKFFNPVLEKFGGNLYQVVVGGAPLNPETEFLLTSIGINIINGYGITECAPLVAANCTRFSKPGSAGMICPDVKVRIACPDENGNGEIQVKGDNVMLGYYKDPENTEKSFTDDGWFKTGDLGHLDKHNFLYITGRLKNLIILANGKNVYPEEVEEMMTNAIPYISEVVVYADAENTGIYASCYLDEVYIKTNNIADPQAKLREDVAAWNKTIPSYKRVTDVFVSEIEFEKTTTRKIKRNTVEKKVG